jgi:hypothetical protein
MSETEPQQKPIPIFLYNLDLAELIERCRLCGYGNAGERWTDAKLDEQRMPSSTLREIQKYKPKEIGESTIDSIVRVFGRDFADKNEWKRIVKDACRSYIYRVTLRDKFTNCNVVLPECLLRGPRNLFNPDGTWIYALANYDGRHFDVGAI